MEKYGICEYCDKEFEDKNKCELHENNCKSKFDKNKKQTKLQTKSHNNQ